MSEQVWIVYDGRAESMSTDDCTVYATADSESEGWEFIDEMFSDGVLFVCDIEQQDGKDVGVNERRVYR